VRTRRTLVLGLAVAGLLAGCTGSGDPEPTPSSTTAQTQSPTPNGGDDRFGGTLRFALTDNPASIDPRFVRDDGGLAVVDALFDSLVRIGDDLITIEPAAATDWEISEDGLTYTFNLRDDGVYHDGSPVMAQDFVRSFQRIVDRTVTPESFLFYQLEPVVGYEDTLLDGAPLAGITAPEDTVLEIRLRRATSEFLHVLAHPSLAPVPEIADDDPERYEVLPIGNGPFAMAEPWQPNQFIRVTRFADHTQPPFLDEVVFQIFAEERGLEQQYDDFVAGRVDVAQVPPDRLREARATYGQSSDGRTGPGLIDGLTGTVYYYGFNVQLAPFDDATVRRALSMLIDRERIVQEILLDSRIVADGLVPRSLPGSTRAACEICTFDPDAARAELGLEDDDDAPFAAPLELVYNTSTTNERIAQRVAADISDALGVDVETRDVPLRELLGELREGTIGFFRLGWQPDHPSAGAILEPLFHSRFIGQDNLTRFQNDEVDALLDQARGTADATERLALYGQVEALVLELAPVAPIFFYPQARVVANTVEQLRWSPVGTVDLARAWKLTPA
jgi:oligopeptide transport system substrate-binding protein